MTTINNKTIDLATFTRSYRGRSNACRCGCAGRYSSRETLVARDAKAVLALIETGTDPVLDVNESTGQVECITVQSGNTEVSIMVENF